MQRQAIQVSVMRVDWSRWRGLGVTGRISPRFAHLLQSSGVATHNGQPSQELANGRGSDRSQLETQIRDKVARILGTTPDRLDYDKPLLNLGIDSLMAVELRNWIEQEWRINVPIMELIRSPSLSHLTAQLREQLSSNADTPTPARLSTEPQAAENLLAKIEDLADEDVDALLTALLDENSRGRSAIR